jgi:tripartite-type tricarboxylate transporter receptor subunit TctC
LARFSWWIIYKKNLARTVVALAVGLRPKPSRSSLLLLSIENLLTRRSTFSYSKKNLHAKEDPMDKDKRILYMALALVVLLLLPAITYAAAPFYEGKNIRVIVAGSPGGGFDSYARALARHLGKHVPGKPTIMIENMTGAGGLVAANYLYKIAKPDGLTIGHFHGGFLFAQALGLEGTEFEPQKFGYIGSLSKVAPVCILSRARGIGNMDQWMNSTTPPKLGGIAPGALAPEDTPKILKVALGLPLHLVSGYKGTAEIRLALQSKEVDGCFLGWESAKTTWRRDLEDGSASVILQAVPKPLLDFPKVPLAIDFAKTDEGRKLIEVGIHTNCLFARPFVLPPGTPGERIHILRNGLEETLRDKDFIAETEKAQLDLDPVTGPELEEAVTGLCKADPALLAKLKDILYK